MVQSLITWIVKINCLFLAVKYITDWEQRQKWDKTFDVIDILERSGNFNVIYWWVMLPNTKAHVWQGVFESYQLVRVDFSWHFLTLQLIQNTLLVWQQRSGFSLSGSRWLWPAVSHPDHAQCHPSRCATRGWHETDRYPNQVMLNLIIYCTWIEKY